jgi:hypothetical protein
MLLTLGVCTGCVAPKNFNHIPHDPIKARKAYLSARVWSGPCYEARVKRAKEILLADSSGRPWVALYFMRCTPKDDWVGRIVPRKSRYPIR